MARSNTANSGNTYFDLVIQVVSTSDTQYVLRAVIYLKSPNVIDSNNNLSVTGNWSRSGALALNGVYNNVPVWYQDIVVARQFGVATNVTVNASWSGVEYWGVTLSASEGYSVPARPAYIAPHSHPVLVSTDSIGTTSATGATTTTATREPPARLLRVVRATAGNLNLRIIGLWDAPASGLPAGLTLCDGTNGTPDLRGLFVRQRGTGGLGSTVGQNTHSHSINAHTHTLGSHTHTLQFGASGSFHTHPDKTTSATTPTVTATSGTTDTVSHVPLYRKVHFARLDGVGSDPLDAPVTVVSQWGEVETHGIDTDPGMDRLVGESGQAMLCDSISYTLPRSSISSVPIGGGLPTVSTVTPGKDVTVSLSVKGRTAVRDIETILSDALVYLNPWGGQPGWFAPGPWTVTPNAPGVKTVQVTMVAQPPPALPNPEELL